VDVDLGKDSFDCVGFDQGRNVRVDVLDAAVHVDLWGHILGCFFDSLGCLNDELCCSVRIEGWIDTPSQDTPRKIVDDSVHVNPRTVDQFQDGCVDVPNLVRLRSPDADFGFSGIDAIPGPFPPLFPNDSKPARLRCKNLSEFASEPH